MTTELHYIDFTPVEINKSFWKGAKYESTEQVLPRVNDWIKKNYNRKIINVETVMAQKSSRGQRVDDVTSINMHAGIMYTIPVIRVWYQ
ncbi:MAG: hypothetical protein WBA16_09455 [Nonlabens sp.]